MGSLTIEAVEEDGCALMLDEARLRLVTAGDLDRDRVEDDLGRRDMMIVV